MQRLAPAPLRRDVSGVTDNDRYSAGASLHHSSSERTTEIGRKSMRSTPRLGSEMRRCCLENPKGLSQGGVVGIKTFVPHMQNRVLIHDSETPLAIPCGLYEHLHRNCIEENASAERRNRWQAVSAGRTWSFLHRYSRHHSPISRIQAVGSRLSHCAPRWPIATATDYAAFVSRSTSAADDEGIHVGEKQLAPISPLAPALQCQQNGSMSRPRRPSQLRCLKPLLWCAVPGAIVWFLTTMQAIACTGPLDGTSCPIGLPGWTAEAFAVLCVIALFLSIRRWWLDFVQGEYFRDLETPGWRN